MTFRAVAVLLLIEGLRHLQNSVGVLNSELFIAVPSNMKHTLVSWLGMTDLGVASGVKEGYGPIGNAVRERPFDRIVLLSNSAAEDNSSFESWLQTLTSSRIDIHPVKLSSPMDFRDVYEAAHKCVQQLCDETEDIRLTFHLSPGTSAMCAMWLILATTKFDAELIASSPESGVYTPEFPFEVAADYLPRETARAKTKAVIDVYEGRTPAAFERIIHRCDAMKRVVSRAQQVAQFDVPVMILGESGTGKELFAEAIHKASPRASGPYVTVNCGAFPESLVESELFGHVAGAFTDAKADRIGRFEEAHGGTLFLDELGELPLTTQVKLLRTLQEGEIRRVGDTMNVSVDVRVISATNKDLPMAIAEKEFRADLFHRLAIGILTLPPLRERKGDLQPLIDDRMGQIAVKLPAGKQLPRLSNSAKKVLKQHSWPGNIRELYNALSRAVIWCADQEITAAEMTSSLLKLNREDSLSADSITLGNGFDMKEFLTNLERDLVQRAMQEGVRQADAARLLGISSALLRQKLKKHS